MAKKRGNNEGTIFRKPNGKWRAQVSISGRRFSFTANTRAECHDWLRKSLDQIDQGMTFEGRNLSLAEYLKDWISIKKNALRIKTAFQYERLISLYLATGLGKVKLKDLSLRIVNQFYDSLVQKGVGISNIRYSHRILHAALEQAVKNGVIGRNPAHGATVPKPIYKEMQILNDQQVGIFLAAASGSRYKGLYHLVVATGMRFSELRGLQWSDVDWAKGTISVLRQIQDIPRIGPVVGPPKTESGKRMILLGESTLLILKEQKQRVDTDKLQAGDQWKENELIFPSTIGTPFSCSNLRKDYISVLQVANLRRIRFHDLRHTSASLLLNHKIPDLVVSKILGHADPTVTKKVYAHSPVEMQAEAVSIMDGIINPISDSVPQLHSVAPETK